MEHVKKELEKFFRNDDRMRTLTMSIGIAKSENDEADLDLLLQQSDDALYWSKEHGRNQYTLYDEVLNDLVNFKKHMRQGGKKDGE